MDASVLSSNYMLHAALVLLLVTTFVDDILCATCPLHHPYAYHRGTHCCLHNKEKTKYDYRAYNDTNCDGGNITITSECCVNNAYVPCEGRTCVTPSFESGPCIEEFPHRYYHGLYCCKWKQEKVKFSGRSIQSLGCSNGDLGVDSLCCIGDSFIPCANPPCTSMSWWSLTWNAEGNDDPTSTNFSRKLRVPAPAYGVTIGRGYDMLHRNAYYIGIDFVKAGIPATTTTDLVAGGEGLQGSEATQYITTNNLQNFIITHVQQWELFKIARDNSIAYVKNYFASVVKTYGSVDFDTLHDSIKGLVVDLAIRREYTTSARTILQPKIVANDVAGVKTIISNRSLWPSVPLDRFNRRIAYMEKQ